MMATDLCPHDSPIKHDARVGSICASQDSLLRWHPFEHGKAGRRGNIGITITGNDATKHTENSGTAAAPCGARLSNQSPVYCASPHATLATIVTVILLRQLSSGANLPWHTTFALAADSFTFEGQVHPRTYSGQPPEPFCLLSQICLDVSLSTSCQPYSLAPSITPPPPRRFFPSTRAASQNLFSKLNASSRSLYPYHLPISDQALQNHCCHVETNKRRQRQQGCRAQRA